MQPPASNPGTPREVPREPRHAEGMPTQADEGQWAGEQHPVSADPAGEQGHVLAGPSAPTAWKLPWISSLESPEPMTHASLSTICLGLWSFHHICLPPAGLPPTPTLGRPSGALFRARGGISRLLTEHQAALGSAVPLTASSGWSHQEVGRGGGGSHDSPAPPPCSEPPHFPLPLPRHRSLRW